MRLFFLSALFFISTVPVNAQTFNGGGGAIPGSGVQSYNATITGIGTINSSKGLSQVCMNINHPAVDELEILLQAPDGTYVPLTIQNGAEFADNYTNTCFSATASTPIKFGTAPFTGTFLPEGHLGAVNNGQDADGVWSLYIRDRRNAATTGTNAGTGSIANWSLTFSNNPAPQPTALPNCTKTIPSTSDCASATSICDFNGACGSTTGSTKRSWAALDAASCFGLNNNSFVKFIADAPTVSFSVWVTSSNNGFNNVNGGIQMLFFSTPSCGGPVTTYGCYNRIYPYPSTNKPLISVIYAQGLTPGNTYYLLTDGANGDLCNFRIAANSGVNVLNITSNTSSNNICLGETITFNAAGGNGIYTWEANNPSAGLSATSGNTVNATPTTTGQIRYSLNSTTGLGCPTSSSIDINVSPQPAAPVLTITPPSCNLPTGTITITNVAGATYSIDGTNYQTSNIFSGLTPGNYTLSIKNAGGCISPSSSAIINPAPTGITQSYIYSIIDPTCTNRSGGIVVQQPLGNNYEYNLNGGAYQSTPSFSNLPSGSYTTSVRDNISGCFTPASTFTIKASPPIPATPVVSVTQPTCSVSTGTITFNPVSGNSYSIDGNNYLPNNIFSALSPGSYKISVQNAEGCRSVNADVVLNIPICVTNDLFVPNAFTPNGDGKNDILLVKGTSIKSLQLLIFNQWGEKVFESVRPDIGWDGNVSGKPQPVGVYVYVLKAELLDGSTQQLKGSITLIR
jgi:gliding motility-associated-like protein